MKKFIILLLILMNLTSVTAIGKTPRFIIYAASSNRQDVEEMYDMKNNILQTYREYAKGVSNTHHVMKDIEKKFGGSYKDGLYTLSMGSSKEKYVEGLMKVSYCTSSQEINKKLWIISMFES